MQKMLVGVAIIVVVATVGCLGGSESSGVNPEGATTSVFAGMHADCEKDGTIHITLQPLADTQTISVVVNVSNSSSVEDRTIEVTDLNAGVNKTVNLNLGKILYGDYKIQVCAQGQCVEDSCYVSMYVTPSYRYEVVDMHLTSLGTASSIGNGCDSLDIQNTGSKTMLAGTAFKIRGVSVSSPSPMLYVKLKEDLPPNGIANVGITQSGMTTKSAIPHATYRLEPSVTESDVSGVIAYNDVTFYC